MSNAIYAGGRARALEKNLIGGERINRMIDSLNADEALKILSETNFGEGVSVASALDFEKLLSMETEKLDDFVRADSPTQVFKKFLLYSQDFANAEAIVKAKYLKTDFEKMTSPDGLFKIEKMKELIFTDEYRTFPKEMASALSLSDEAFVSGTASGTKISGFFSKAYFAELYAETKGDKFLSDVFRAKTDAVNISLALRTRDYAYAKNDFIPYGDINELEFKSLCSLPFETLKTAFKVHKRSDFVISAISDAENNNPLTVFEKISDNYPLDKLYSSRFTNDGACAFMQYCFYKLADIKNVRIILVGLINGLSKSEIKERLRKYYVG